MDTALASALAAATRAANRPVAELCAEALAQHDAAQDAALAARRVPLEHLAASSAASRSALAAIHAALERFHTQLKSASEHIQQLQDKSISLSEQLDTRAHEEAVLAEWLGAGGGAPPRGGPRGGATPGRGGAGKTPTVICLSAVFCLLYTSPSPRDRG